MFFCSRTIDNELDETRGEENGLHNICKGFIEKKNDA